jgi:hypothetical protein
VKEVREVHEVEEMSAILNPFFVCRGPGRAGIFDSNRDEVV